MNRPALSPARRARLAEAYADLVLIELDYPATSIARDALAARSRLARLLGYDTVIGRALRAQAAAVANAVDPRDAWPVDHAEGE